MTESDTTTRLYQAISAQPGAVRALLADWDGPTQVAQRLAGSGRVLLAGIGTSYHAAIVGEFLLRLVGCDAWATRSQELVSIPTLMEHILTHQDTLWSIAHDAVAHRRRIYFLGAGPNTATASEGALKAKEAAYVTTEGFELEQAIHGPLVAFEANDLIIPISVPGPAQARMRDLLLALSEIGTRLLLLGDAPDAETAALLQHSQQTRFALTEHDALLEELTPILAALPVQLLAHFLALARGTNPDSFRLDSAVYKRANKRFSL